MAKHELHLVHVPEHARARLVALTRRHAMLDEQAVLRAVSGSSEQTSPIAVAGSLAAAEALQAELNAIGCESVLVEQDSLAADLRDRVGQIFGRRRGGSSSSAAVVAAPVQPTPTAAAGAATGGSLAAGASGRVYERLHGSSPQDLERADARRRLRIRLAVFAGIVLVMGVVASIFLGLSSLAGRLVDTPVDAEQIDPDGNMMPGAEQRAPAAGAAGANDDSAEQGDQSAGDQAAGGEGEPGAGREGGAPPREREPAAAEQTAQSQPGANRQQHNAAGENAPPQAGERPSEQPDPAASTPPSPSASRNTDEQSSPAKNMRIVVLALAAFIGFVGAMLLLVTARAIARRLSPAWAKALRVGVAVALVGGAATAVVASRPAPSPPVAVAASSPPATPAAPALPPETSALAEGSAAAIAEAPAPVAAEGSGDGASASMSAFVHSLSSAPPAAATPPFTAMAQALARRRAGPAEADGSGVSEGSGALVAESDLGAAEPVPTATMVEFVDGLQPPTRCDEGGTTPFAAMHCRLDEAERHERRRAREAEAAPEPAPAPEADDGRGEQAVAGEAPAEASGGAVADPAPEPAAAPEPAEPPAPASAPASEPEEPAMADMAKRREWGQESLACALGAMLALFTDLIGAFISRRKRQRSA
jgi:hypothetical protein